MSTIDELGILNQLRSFWLGFRQLVTTTWQVWIVEHSSICGFDDDRIDELIRFPDT